MTQYRIKLSIFSIMLIACLIALLLTFNDDAPIKASSEIDVISSSESIVKTEIDTKELASTTDTLIKNTSQEHDRQNGQLVVMHRPEWKFDKNLLEQFEKLKIEAASGDNEASYILARNLRYCHNSPIDERALEQLLAQANQYSDSDIAVTRITERYEYCSGVNQKQRKQFYSYLQAAANNGYVYAQEAIGSITPEYFMEFQGYKNLERDEYVATRDNFIEQKVIYLEQAAENGSISALSRLSRMNRSQKIAGNGYVKSYGFNQLILELTQDNETYSRYSRYQQKLQSQLTPEEMDNAFAISEQWLTVIKANGTLYLAKN